jgi:hypothetical protein
MNIAQLVVDDSEERSQEDLNDIDEEIQFNQDTQHSEEAGALTASKDPEVADKAYTRSSQKPRTQHTAARAR